MIAYRYLVRFAAVEDQVKPDDLFVIVIAPNGETARMALNQQFPQPGTTFAYTSQTNTIIQTQ